MMAVIIFIARGSVNVAGRKYGAIGRRRAACAKIPTATSGIGRRHRRHRPVSLSAPSTGTAAMINFKAIDELAQRLGELLPPGIESARADIEKNFRATLQAGLGRLDLVTREEFDVQRAVLLRTREKLDALERVVTDLEAQLRAGGPPASGSH
jgi:ubiquinone biosynthesis accessory factor UbiK